MNNPNPTRRKGFTLLETVIAIGVLTVLLTGFIMVFGPAAAGIKKAIDVQEADRLASTLEKEMVTLRQGQGRGSGDFSTGFDKAYNYIKDSNSAKTAILIYKYRGKLGGTTRQDGTPEPEPAAKDNVPGKDYVVQTMVRAFDDNNFLRDLKALEGPVYLVKCTQLVYNNSGELVLGSAGQIVNPNPKGGGGTGGSGSNGYPEALIAFAADFYTLPGRTESFFSSNAFTDAFTKATKPVFSRNLAVRR